MKNNVELAIEALQSGKMILLTDHPGRENEADLIFPAETITPEIMNFMIRHCSGIVCVSMTDEYLQRLALPLIVPPYENTSRHTTPFTIPVDAKEGITTGVSAMDRVVTIRAMMNEHAKPEDLARPGHMFPLQAKAGGVLERAGHTEGAMDIVKLAGFKPVAVLCEVMNPDGTMARGESLIAFAKEHELPLLSIAELITHRLQQETQIQASAKTKINLEKYGEFEVTALEEKRFSREHLTLFKKPLDPSKPLLVRIHSACATGDTFGSTRCDCHQQLHYALQKISEEGGLLIYLDQEGRGIGLVNKLKAYALQDQGLDTVDANEKLGLPVDEREYYIAAQILKDLSISEIRLLTNNPKKISGLASYGFSGAKRESMPNFCHAHNKKYLMTKKERLGHLIEI